MRLLPVLLILSASACSLPPESADSSPRESPPPPYAFVADLWDGVQIVDVSSPDAPVAVSVYDTPGQAYGVAYANGTLYVADGSAGLQTLDVTDPLSPKHVATTPMGFGLAVHTEKDGTRAYVADFDQGIHVVDGGAIISGAPTPDHCMGIDIVGNLAYLAVRSAGVMILDLSDMSILGTVDTPSVAQDVEVIDGIAYIADGHAGLQIVDVTDPAHPVLLGEHNTPHDATRLTVSGDFAYIADTDAGLRILDVRDPSAPFEAGFYDTPTYRAQGVAFAAGYVYIAEYDSGLTILDARDPTAPEPIGVFDTPGNGFGVAVMR